MHAKIAAIEYHLPSNRLTNEDLSAIYGAWSPEKIESKTGIVERRISDADECSSDLAEIACRKLFSSGACKPEDIDFLLLCTQSPDFFLPTTACILQNRLGLPLTAGALDFNLGCSGFVYGLGLAKGLIETGQAKRVLLVTAETYSKFIHPGDRSVRSIFGDGAAATLVVAGDGSEPSIGPFIYGTDGSGARNLIVPVGGMRKKKVTGDTRTVDEFGNERTAENLYMNGAEVFTFTLRAVPEAVRQLLDRSRKTLDEFDLVVFHQANHYMLEHLRKRLEIPTERFYVALRKYGNTVSATIPIALKDAMDHGVLTSGMTVMLVGFGVGYSWAATVVNWA
ncbi:MAG TPA: ketoacyl-ACP synthase III [Clostridia bacterium]|nr:ketoacyl-ACP synthase III [Clostridia bacterium]